MTEFEKGDRVVLTVDQDRRVKAGDQGVIEIVSFPVGRNIFVRISGDRGVWVKDSHLKLDDSSQPR
jgi:hypothetical protein